MRYEYTFESVPYTHGDTGYQAAIQRAGAAGWRLVQVLVERPAVMPDHYVLVLERAVAAD